MLGHGLRTPRSGQGAGDLRQGAIRQQVEQHGGGAVTVDPVADRRRERVDQAALDARGGEHEFALAWCFAGQRQADRLQRRAGEFLPQMRTPAGHFEAAVGRLQRRDGDAAVLEQGHPGAIRTQSGPTAAAEGEQGGVRLDPGFALRPGDTQRAMLVPAQPALAGMQLHAAFTQALEPGAQQGRGLHVGRKHPARTADKGVDAQPVNPFAQ